MMKLRKSRAGRGSKIVLIALLLLLLIPLVVFGAGTATPHDLSRTATEMTWTQAVTSGVEFANNGRTLLMVRSLLLDSTVVITTPKTYHGYAIEDATFTIASGEVKVIGPFPPDVFNDSSGNVTVVAIPNIYEVTAKQISVTVVRF